MDETGEFPYEVRGYCATCRKHFGLARKECLGRRIDCSNADHLAQVISVDDAAAWWLRREAWLLHWQTHRSPFAKLRRAQSRLNQKLAQPLKPIQAGHFLLLYFGVIAFALILEERDWPPLARGIARATLGLLLLWRFIDIFLSNTSITFTSRFPANPLRSVAFSLATYFQIVLCYAYFYSVLVDIGAVAPKANEPFSVVEMLYFSFGTIATVGYGMVEAKNALGKMVVASELVLGLYFVVIILAQVAAWSANSKVELGRFPWDDLKRS